MAEEPVFCSVAEACAAARIAAVTLRNWRNEHGLRLDYPARGKVSFPDFVRIIAVNELSSHNIETRYCINIINEAFFAFARLKIVEKTSIADLLDQFSDGSQYIEGLPVIVHDAPWMGNTVNILASRKQFEMKVVERDGSLGLYKHIIDCGLMARHALQRFAKIEGRTLGLTTDDDFSPPKEGDA